MAKSTIDMTKRERQRDERRWQRETVEAARHNYIWLDGFSCIRPTAEFERHVGRSILNMLSVRENLIAPEFRITGDEGELIVRIYKS